MKYLSILPLFFLLGCSPAATPDKPHEEIPKALKDENSEVRLKSYSDSYREDLVEELFEEIQNKNPEFKGIAALMGSLRNMKQDSLSKFQNFKQKSTGITVTRREILHPLTIVF